MTRRRLYNPAQLSDDELKASFIARHETLDQLLQLLREQDDGSPCQHVLLVGPRGMGKTTLGLRFLYAISDTPALCEKWQPVAFHEESYGICDVADFWIAALHHLARTTGDAQWSEKADALLEDETNPARLAAYARAALMDYCQSSGKRLILFVENIDTVLDQFGNEREVHTLRASLMESSEIMLVGSANTVFGGIRSHGEPFYEFFRLFILQGLTAEETFDVLKQFADSAGEKDVLTLLDLGQGRLETIRRLTGGNPRLLALTCDMLLESPLGESFEVLERLIDEQTPYFKARIEELPIQARKVFHCLANAWTPMLAREVARASKLGSSHASAQLKQLVSKGYVNENKDKKGKKIRYDVSDRFYNIYFLLRFSRGGRVRLRRLVGFMQDLFGRDALHTMYSATLKALDNAKLSRTETADWLSVLAGCVEADDEFGPREIWRRAAVDVAERLIGPGAGVIDQINRVAWRERGHRLYNDKRYEDAASAYRKAIEEVPTDHVAWTGLGKSLFKLSRHDEAVSAVRHVVKLIDPKDSSDARNYAAAALLTQAGAYVELKRHEEAIASVEELTRYMRSDDPEDLRSTAVISFAMYGLLLSESGRHEDATSVLDLSDAYFRVDDMPETRRGGILVLSICGTAFAKSGRRDEAVATWGRVRDYVRPEDSAKTRHVALTALEEFSNQLMEWERHEEALIYQELVVEYMRADDPPNLRGSAVRTLSAGGFALAAAERSEEAIRLLERVADFARSDDPPEVRLPAATAHGLMGQALVAEEMYDEAMSARDKSASYVSADDPFEFRQLIAQAFAGDGAELNRLGRYSEAEAICKNAIRVAPESATAWHTLAVAVFRADEGTRLREAEEHARRAAELVPDEPGNAHILSDILALRGEWNEALQWLERALLFSIKEEQDGERSGLIESLIEAVASNQGLRVKNMMKRVGAIDIMEPLWYAVRTDLGEDVEPLPTEISNAVKALLEEISTRRS
ncbi:MAG: tetratricopeptide repeat protein [Rhodobacteraceae bacterium]|nr:tetratricopeptide repeat protein [Paracoccaceae bacterium]